MGHHMAPVAGGVTDAEQDRLALSFRKGEGLRAPGLPVDGIVGMLKEIGARFRAQHVFHGGILFCWWHCLSGRYIIQL